MKKKIFGLIITLIMAVSLVGVVPVVTVGAETYRDYEYEILDDGTVMITGYTGGATELEIPSMINGKTVTSICAWAFYTEPNHYSNHNGFCKQIKSIVIPSSIIRVGYSAFPNCMHFEEIIVDSNNPNYSSIDGVMYDKEKTKLIKCPGAKISVSIPSSVKTIAEDSFWGCEYISNITIPNGVTTIERLAFHDCRNLTSAVIPSSVKDIGERAIGIYLENLSFKTNKNMIIYCSKDSVAEKYAIEHEIDYEIIGESSGGSTGGTSGPQTGSGVKTSTDYRYPKKFATVKSIYGAIKKGFKDKYNFAIPGLEMTNVLGSSCDTMVPQGICIAENYVLITAYCSNSKHESVIYVLDKNTGKYKTTLVLSDKNHVGGIAFDGTYVWIAKSTTKKLSAISFSNIIDKINQGVDSIYINYDKTVSCGRTASFVTYYDNKIWVGTFNSNANGVLEGFNVNGTSLTSTKKINIPKKANGATFVKYNNQTYLIVNSSHGRNNNSGVYKWTDLENGTNKKIATLPPMAEEVCIDNGKIYTIFESAATRYSTKFFNKCLLPIDRVCVGNVQPYLGLITSKAKTKSLSRSYTTTDEDGNIYEYDDNGNITYYEDTDGFWYRSEYDENCNEIFCEYSDGYVDNNTYDNSGNMQSSVCTSSDGTWVKASYNKSGNITSYEDSDNFWYKSSFDKNENEIYYEDSNNISYKQNYDEAGNLTYYSDNKGGWQKYEYDENGNQTYYENSDGYWINTSYDEDGNVISSEEGDKPNQSTNNTSAKPVINPTTKTTIKPTRKKTTTKITKPAKVTKVKLKTKKKKLSVTWKKISGAKGYQVISATNKKFTKNKKTVNAKKNKVTLKKLKSKKKYYVKVRAYKTVNGKKFYGKWSKVISKKTK